MCNPYLYLYHLLIIIALFDLLHILFSYITYITYVYAFNLRTLVNVLRIKYVWLCIIWEVTGRQGRHCRKINAVYLVMQVLLYYLYCLLLDTWGKNLRNTKLMIKSFLEGFHFVLKCHYIRFDASLGFW